VGILCVASRLHALLELEGWEGEDWELLAVEERARRCAETGGWLCCDEECVATRCPYYLRLPGGDGICLLRWGLLEPPVEA